MVCKYCNKKAIKVGEVWENDYGYRVKILDMGSDEVWLLYLDNNNRVGWQIKNFLDVYKPIDG